MKTWSWLWTFPGRMPRTQSVKSLVSWPSHALAVGASHCAEGTAPITLSAVFAEPFFCSEPARRDGNILLRGFLFRRDTFIAEALSRSLAQPVGHVMIKRDLMDLLDGRLRLPLCVLRNFTSHYGGLPQAVRDRKRALNGTVAPQTPGTKDYCVFKIFSVAGCCPAILATILSPRHTSTPQVRHRSIAVLSASLSSAHSRSTRSNAWSSE
jgi:hypothetical protein